MSTALSNGKPNPIAPEILDRQPPSDLDAEKGVLGSILMKPEICGDVLSLVGPDDFYDEANQKLFAHMQGIHGTGAKPDITLLANRLNASGDYDDIGGAGYLADISRSVPHAENVLHYAGAVRESSVKRQINLAIGELLRGSYNGAGANELLDLAAQSFAEIRIRANLDQAVRPIAISTLIQGHPQLGLPIIGGLLRAGETGNIIADPKRGKSWLAYGLALSVCIGDKWLGTFDCLAQRVLLIDNELHPATLAHRIPVVANALGIREEEYADRLDVISLRGRLVDLYGIARLLESVKPGTYGLVVLDAYYRSLPPDVSENDNAEVAQLYNLIDKTTARLGCCWVNIHHASKGSQATKSVTDVGAGAGAQSRAADCHLILREHEERGCVVLESVVRSFKPVRPMTLRWEFPVWQRADDVDPAAVKGRGTKTEERKSQADRDDCYKLIEALRPKAATVRILRGKTGLSPDRCNRLLDLLESKKTVAWKEVKKRGNRCREYRLLNDAKDVDG